MHINKNNNKILMTRKEVQIYSVSLGVVAHTCGPSRRTVKSELRLAYTAGSRPGRATEST